MKPRISSIFVRLAYPFVILLWSCLSSGYSQEGFRSVDPQPVAETSSALDRGIQLEEQRRWGEALTHYEDASRRFPEDAQLKNRVIVARLHFDLGRRYTDRSYLRLMKEMTEQQSLDLFGEVISKIQTHYVHEPDWNDLLRRGTDGLAIALSDSAYCDAHKVHLDNRQADALVKYVQQVLAQRDVRDRRPAQELVRWVGQMAERRLQVSAPSVVLEYMCSAMSALDAYSTYLTSDQLDEVYSQIEGNFVGLGIELKGDDGTLLIADVIENGPADRAGIQAGDRIIEVDAQPTQDLSTDRAADLLKGEQGTYVEVALRDVSGKTRRLQVRRERVEVPSVEDVKIVDSAAGVGYFRISSFQKTTSRDVDAALWNLHR